MLGVTTNAWFWWRYGKLNRERPDAILAAQNRLYRAKTLVDACVTMALAWVAAAPAATLTRRVDQGGSAAVVLYLVMTGIATMRGRDLAACNAGGLTQAVPAGERIARPCRSRRRQAVRLPGRAPLRARLKIISPGGFVPSNE